MDLSEQIRRQSERMADKMDADRRAREQRESIDNLCAAQSFENALHQSEISELRKQNAILKDALEKSQKNSKISTIINIAVGFIALLSLVVSIIALTINH